MPSERESEKKYKMKQKKKQRNEMKDKDYARWCSQRLPSVPAHKEVPGEVAFPQCWRRAVMLLFLVVSALRQWISSPEVYGSHGVARASIPVVLELGGK
ncbi:hypothetical protein AVEN_126993-1 [Araneus ventricosus]|uniref:Uncharacterized protein n=1 Tax=Araneus ventricosus TaxID=182803 RepID=A0A4Y2C288_ARAVE|nr:hypothetical protein AVEN_126993-1 [Araneus ventricosus]